MVKYTHDPQNEVVLWNLAQAKTDVGSVHAQPVDGLGIMGSRGIRHGAVGVDVLLRNVRVAGKQHFFCESHGCEVISGSPLGDGLSLEDETPCRIDVHKVPPDGEYDMRLRITANNGTVDLQVVDWIIPGSDEVVRARRKVAGICV